jgi:hypothetical protein
MSDSIDYLEALVRAQDWSTADNFVEDLRERMPQAQIPPFAPPPEGRSLEREYVGGCSIGEAGKSRTEVKQELLELLPRLGASIFDPEGSDSGELTVEFLNA